MPKEQTATDFLKLHREGMEVLGFWNEVYKSSMCRAYERMWKSEIIREWTIVDMVNNGDEHFLIKWVKRITPLNDQELKELYGSH